MLRFPISSNSLIEGGWGRTDHMGKLNVKSATIIYLKTKNILNISVNGTYIDTPTY